MACALAARCSTAGGQGRALAACPWARARAAASTPSGLAASSAASRAPGSGSCRAASCCRRSALLRQRCGAKGSSTCTPARVRWAEASRSTPRLPCQAATGVCSTSCARALAPGASSLPCSSTRVPSTSALPRCTCTRWPERRGRSSPCQCWHSTSRRRLDRATEGAHSQWPRCTASLAIPARARAQRSPAWADSACWLCTWMPRTRTLCPLGAVCSTSPTATRPLATMPVTTVPTPERVKLRSTARRKPCAASAPGRAWCAWAQLCRCARRASTPSPLYAETAKTGACASAVGASRACTWACSAASRAVRSAVGMRSILVSTTVAWVSPSRASTARCSRVCGMTPSSAATMSSACAMPVAPASMVCSRRSCPGISTNPSTACPGGCR